MKPDQDIELVVVGFSGELKMLELQARSLAKFAPGVFSRLNYVVNERHTRAFLRFFEGRIRPELGPLANIAVVTPGSELAQQKLKRTDWRSQQSLKLLAARLVQAPQFLILDSKNHFVRPVTPGTFVSDTGRMKTHRYGLNEKFQPMFHNACRYFGVKPPTDGFLALPTVTPYMMRTKCARELVLAVEERENTPFHSFFCGNKDFTEFYFYLAYLLSRQGLLEQLYETRPRPQVTLFRSVSDNPQTLHQLLPILDQDEVYCFGVHRALLEQADSRINQAIAQEWMRFGLVEGQSDADYFLTPDVVKQKPWYRPF